MFKEWQRHHPKNVLGLLNVRIFNFSEILHRYTYNHIQEEWPFYPPWNKQPAPENSCLEAYFFLCGMAYSQGVFAVKLSGSVTGFVSSRWSWMFSLSQLRCLGFRLGRMLYTGPCTCLLRWGSNSLWGEMASRDCCTWMGNSSQFFPRNHSRHQVSVLGS